MRYSALFLKLMEKRGLDEEFLNPCYEKLADPYLLPDMKEVVSQIKQAVSSKKKILIYGDYDVDGVTATAILHDTLILAGMDEKNIEMMLPDRFSDGYGMSEKVVERAKDFGLVITVDCGSNNREVIEKISVPVVVTDHHEVMGELPETAVVNPKRTDKEVPEDLKNLCGAGVAFFLARALVSEGLVPEGQEKWLLDLAMIGTICDAMKLTGENRVICRFGMLVLSKTRRPGLLELMRLSGVKKIDTDAVGFQIGPRLNAAGRMKSADLALKLLLTESKAEAVKLAEELEQLNAERKRQQSAAVSEIEKKGISVEPVLVVAGEWHEGVLGIIAGRLLEQYKKPAIVLSEIDGVLKGSGRSFGEFNLAEALKECQKLLINGGGHAEACGLKLEKEHFLEFSRAINEYYKSLGLKNQERFLEKQADLTVGKLSSVSLDFMGELELLQPFGDGNPEPLLALREVEVRFVDRMGTEGKHLRLTVSDGASTMRLLAFYAPEEWFKVQPGETISVLVSPFVNEWNGVSSVEGRIVQIKK